MTPKKWAGQGPDTPVSDVAEGGGGGEGVAGKHPQGGGKGDGMMSGAGSVATTAPSSLAPPVRGKVRVTETFMSRKDHKGIDFAAPQGTTIEAADRGRVLRNYRDERGGWTVILDHGNGIRTGYCHMMAPSPLKEGASVAKSQKIGKVGSTGKSTGPHLHFFVQKNGQYVDPAGYVTFLPASKMKRQRSVDAIGEAPVAT